MSRLRNSKVIRAPGAVPDPPAGPQPVPVGSAAELAVWERIVVDGYPMPDLQPCRPGTLVGPELLEDPRFRFWIGHDDAGAPVTATAQFTARGVAGFVNETTAPYLNLFRRFIPPIGAGGMGLDLSPMIELILLFVVRAVVVGLISG